MHHFCSQDDWRSSSTCNLCFILRPWRLVMVTKPLKQRPPAESVTCGVTHGGFVSSYHVIYVYLFLHLLLPSLFSWSLCCPTALIFAVTDSITCVRLAISLTGISTVLSFSFLILFLRRVFTFLIHKWFPDWLIHLSVSLHGSLYISIGVKLTESEMEMLSGNYTLTV